MLRGAEHLKARTKFRVIFITITSLHLFLLFSKGIPTLNLSSFLPEKNTPTPLKIRRIKTNKLVRSPIKSDYIQLESKKSAAKPNLDLKELSLNSGNTQASPPIRPGTRPPVRTTAIKTLKGIGLGHSEVKQVANSLSPGGLKLSQMINGHQKINDAVVSIEVPEGLEPDELNAVDLKFFSFQKRIAINYINSIIKNLNKFQKKYPRYQVPVNDPFIMRARVTYDSQGNVMQIKMMRWTQISELQNLFEDIVKNIDQAHNPPKELWEKDGEFSMYYTLEIVSG